MSRPVCTLIVLHRAVPGAPLLVGANRDEFFDRPARGPELGSAGARRIVAPRDESAGGTWLGVNEEGVFAAITNRAGAQSGPDFRSRGLVVLDALSAGSAREAAAALGELPARRYAGFQLCVADARDAFAVVYDEKPDVRRLPAGVHVFGNGEPDDRSLPKVDRLLDRAAPLAEGSPQDALRGLADICRSHEGTGSPIEDTCIHTLRYGTRSSTLLRFGESGRPDTLLFTDGAPCSAEYYDVTPLLHGLRAGDQAMRTMR